MVDRHDSSTVDVIKSCIDEEVTTMNMEYGRTAVKRPQVIAVDVPRLPHFLFYFHGNSMHSCLILTSDIGETDSDQPILPNIELKVLRSKI